jgi:hypothetical protein
VSSPFEDSSVDPSVTSGSRSRVAEQRTCVHGPWRHTGLRERFLGTSVNRGYDGCGLLNENVLDLLKRVCRENVGEP